MTETGPTATYSQNRPLDTVPEWSTHSDSPDSYVGPKTPSVSSHADPAMLSTDPVKPNDPPQKLPVENILASFKSAIRRVHPDQHDQQQQRVVITRASTATSRGSDPQDNHLFFPIPTIPERALLSPGSASSVRTTQTNDSVSSCATRRTMSISSALSVIPLTDDGFGDSAGDGVLMKGRLLCAIHMDWYSRRMSAHETSYSHVRLRKSRLQWREFEAVLKTDRMELYLVTNLVIKTRRLAHVIYLDPDALGRRRSKAYNPVRLALVSPLDFIWSLQFRSCEGRNVHFLFAARTVRESQTWYMACYHLTTVKTTPIPALIDLYIPALDNLQIRLPLADLDFQSSNVRVYHVVQCILNILDRQGMKPDDWHYENVSLCWCYEKKPLPEWIPDNGYLMSPHLIEQTHTLELRPDTQRRRQQPRDQLPPPVMEGELLVRQGKKQQMMYAMMEGHLMFLLDPSKASRPLDENGKGRHHTRFTWARSIFASQALHMRSFTRLFRHNNASVTSTAQHAAELEFDRRASNIASALTVIDLSGATKVRRVSVEQPTTFQVTMTTSHDLQFETSTMHTMFEWVQRIQRQIYLQRPKLPPQLCERSVLHSGMLYVRQDYLSTFKQLFCILTREKRLVLYNTCRRVWNDHFVTLSLEQVYVYSSSDEEIHQPPRIYGDGTTVASSDKDCTFVIWQTAQRHILVSLRERLATLKLGHRLGRKGTVWVCLAKSQDEKAAWVYHLHQAIDQAS